jgi:hypothetical protein
VAAQLAASPEGLSSVSKLASEIFSLAAVKVAVFWAVMPFNTVEVHRHFGCVNRLFLFGLLLGDSL